MTKAGQEGAQLLPIEQNEQSRKSLESLSEASTTSLVFERIAERTAATGAKPANGDSSQPYTDNHHAGPEHFDASLDGENGDDLETGPFIAKGAPGKDVDKKFRRLVFIVGGVFIGAWLVALGLFLWNQSYLHSSAIPHDPAATASRGNGKKVTLDEVMGGQWRARKRSISWIEGTNGEDGLLLEQNVPG